MFINLNENSTENIKTENLKLKKASKPPDLVLDSISSPNNRIRLKHLTANRVKGPKRRLPSKRIQKYTI